MLQSSGAIDGIFHKGVVICESDADCRFYELLIRKKEANNEFPNPADLYFIHGGGKGEISTLAESYTSLNIKCSAIADFDILRNKSEFLKLFEILGGTFSKIEKDYEIVIATLNNKGPIKSIKGFSKEMRELISEIESAKKISQANKQAISNLLSDSSDWSEAKKHGKSALKGGAYQSCANILNVCKSFGLFIVPNGELESWWRAGPANKKDWIIEVLNELSKNRSSFKEASEFMDGICAYLNIK